MPNIRGSVAVAGLGQNDNLLANSQYEYLPYDARIDFGINGDANGADLRLDVFSGTDVLLESAPANAQNRMPIWPDDFQLNDVAAGGERLKIRCRNTNAAARTVFWDVKITPLPRRR